MVGKRIEDRASGFEQILCWKQSHLHSRRSEGDAFSDTAGTEKYSLWRFFAQECREDLCVASECSCVVVRGSATRIWKGRLIHELRRGDAAAGAHCVSEERLRL